MPASVFQMPATLLKKKLWYSCFAVNFVKSLRIPSLQRTSGRLTAFIKFSLIHVAFVKKIICPKQFLFVIQINHAN